MMSCIRKIQHFDILSYKNTQIGIRIDAKSIFTFVFFLSMPLKNVGSVMKKTEKSGFSCF